MVYDSLRRAARKSPVLTLASAALVLSACSATPAGDGDGPSAVAPQASIPAQHGPGVTDDTVTLSWSGLFTASNITAELNAQLRSGAEAVAVAFNEDGGLGGRDIVFVDKDPGNALVNSRQEAYQQAQFLPVPDPTNGQAACDAYADASTPVFAILDSNLVSAPLGTAAAGACLNAAGHPIVGATGWTQGDFEAAPATAGVSLSDERWIKGVIAAGEDAGIVGPEQGKIALVTDSTDASGRLSEVYEPALAEAGVTDAISYPVQPSASAAQALNVALKLKDDGVDGIIYLTGPVIAQTLSGVFQEQDYYPRQLALDASPFMPDVAYDDRTLEAVASYVSVPDPYALTPDQQAEQASTPAGELCQAAREADPAASDFVSIDLCDSLMLLKTALEASGSEYLNSQAFAVGIGKLGTGYESPRLFAAEFTDDDHSGAAGLARESYSEKCQCVEVASDAVIF